MFKTIKRFLIAATAVLAVTAPSAAYARFFEYGPPVGSSTSSPLPRSVARLRAAAQLRRLDVLQTTVAQRSASRGGSPSTGVHPAGPSAQAGFQWADAGIGAAGVLALIAIGAGATLVIRRRAREPLVG